jgi:hypothetical protein
MKRRNALLIQVSIMLALLLAPALLAVYVDPFQIFHKSFLPGMGLVNNQRFQNAGLINSYLADEAEQYDSVMIGSSVSDNFSSADVAASLGWNKSLRLFMDGGDPSQLTLTLQHALRKHRVKHILWEIQPRTYSPPRYFLPVNDPSFPDYLYNDNRMDDLRYIFNIDTLKLSWTYATDRGQRTRLTPETVGYVADKPEFAALHAEFNSPENLQKEKATFKNQLPLYGEDKNMAVDTFQYPVIDDIVSPVLSRWCNSETEFVLFIPPISKIDYLGSPKYVFRAAYMVRHLAEITRDCHNMRLHAFDTMDFTSDLNNYVDKIHYRLNINQEILSLIGKHEHMITLDNFEDYKNGFVASVDNFHFYSSYPAATSNSGK